MPKIQFDQIRPNATGTSGSFEELACQIFRRAPESPKGGIFHRIEGSGGDGGVEAIWKAPNGEIWGVQAKFFTSLGNSQKTQMKESLDQAVANHSDLTRYTFCLPIMLTGKTGAKAGKPKLGTIQLVETWLETWRSELAGAGRALNIEVWDAAELEGRLLTADPSGGIRRYWFDGAVLTDSWFSNHLSDAIVQAGKRYSPELSVRVPLHDAIDAFGLTEAWQARTEKLHHEFTDKIYWWHRAIDEPGEPRESTPLPDELLPQARTLASECEKVARALAVASELPEYIARPDVLCATTGAMGLASSLEPLIKAALEARHGAHADTEHFRQFEAEYQAWFPMANLDHLRDLLNVLNKVHQLLKSPEARFPSAPTMLVHGPAGIGKTHGVVDAARDRHESGFRSVVLFGEDFADDDPWSRIAAKLGLSANTGRDEILDALSAAGEATDRPLIIFIDALNETQPDRRRWMAWLPPMMQAVVRRPFLKLCITCRDAYLRDVVPDWQSLPRILHNGFLGREYDAIARFFEYHGLQLPSGPLLQEEFANPLFLRLVCESVKEAGMTRLPVGSQGLTSIIHLLLAAKNERIARECDYDYRENRVKRAALAVAARMLAAGTRQLPLAEAKAAVEEIFPAFSHSTSMFSHLEAESLITVLELPQAGLGSAPERRVRFTFERVGDHFVAEQLLDGFDSGTIRSAFLLGKPLHFTVADSEAILEQQGLLEALSIQIPERFGVELFDVSGPHSDGSLLSITLGGLAWRSLESILPRTEELLSQAMRVPGYSTQAMEILFRLAVRSNHPLNMDFLENMIASQSMIERDPFWAYVLSESFGEQDDMPAKGGAVRWLIEWALRSDLSSLDESTARLWATALGWFCAAPDRRIRDRATKGLVRIFVSLTNVIPFALSKFLLLDDEYVSERVLLAAYGTLLLRPDRDNLRLAASEVWRHYFRSAVTPPVNASLRDHGRLILELASELGVLPEEADPQRFRPPYASDWPLRLPSEAEVSPFIADHDRFPPGMDLTEQMGMAIGTDFARYVVTPRVIREFDIKSAGLDEAGIYRWFMREVEALGYPGRRNRCAGYDYMILQKYGGGRGRRGWVERLGKKYYWILLRRLMGQIADHVPRGPSYSGTVIPPGQLLQSLDIRDIDPTDLRGYCDVPRSEMSPWHIGAPYVFERRDRSNDPEWVRRKDFSDLRQGVQVKSEQQVLWQVLNSSVAWEQDKPLSWTEHKAYRRVVREIRCATCSSADLDKLRARLKAGKWDADLDVLQPHDYRGYIGEFPRRLSYQQRFASGELSFTSELADIAVEALSFLQVKGNEWARDYSLSERAPGLLVPSPKLVEFGELSWDGRGDWKDRNGVVQVCSPQWWTEENGTLLVRQEMLDSFLTQEKLALIIIGYQWKYIVSPPRDENPGQLEEWSVWIREHGQTCKADRHVTVR
jgi:hypothetical protein